jgi:hypothetical protein
MLTVAVSVKKLSWSKLGAKITLASRIFSTFKVQLDVVDGEDGQPHVHCGEILNAMVLENYLRSTSLKEEAGLCVKESEDFFNEVELRESTNNLKVFYMFASFQLLHTARST